VSQYVYSDSARQYGLAYERTQSRALKFWMIGTTLVLTSMRVNTGCIPMCVRTGSSTTAHWIQKAGFVSLGVGMPFGFHAKRELNRALTFHNGSLAR
jgi:hypothetical protein